MTNIRCCPLVLLTVLLAALTRSALADPAPTTRTFAALTGRVVVEARVMAPKTDGAQALPAIGSRRGQRAVVVRFTSGSIVCSDGTATQTAQPFHPGEWYVVRVELDTQTATYDLYIDAIRKVHGAKFQTPVADIAQATFDAAFDNLNVYSHAALIGKPPAPVFDITRYGAVGDGKTNNTNALQKAIDACAGTGGSVVVPAGVFVSGTLRLKSDMTLFVDPAATLLGSPDDADYPRQEIADFPNAAVEGLRKAFLFADGAKNLTIDGGGTIDGNGGLPQWRMNGGESKRPFLLFPVRCENLRVQNVYLKDSAVWCFVPTECAHVVIRNINVDSRDYGNRDGIDIVDCRHVLIENSTLNTDDDTICPKSGIRSGLDDIHVRHCNLMGSGRASGIKFGTLSYGQLKNAIFEDLMIKNCDKAAIGLESVDGADIAHVTFRRITITNTNSPFYLIIGTRGHTPAGDVKKIGSIDDILFEDITGRDLN